VTVEFSATGTIRAPPEAVWRVLTDLEREAQWMRAVGRVEFVGEVKRYAAGARMRRSGRFLWMHLVWNSEIEACEPRRLIRFRHAGAIKGESCWEIEPAPEGCTVRLSSVGPAPGPLKWMPALAAYGGRLGLQGDLARLKRIVETAGPSSGAEGRTER
jgi:uncharacterized protein YndB with AHSA1/START domain